jgi:hypothetical protein
MFDFRGAVGRDLDPIYASFVKGFEKRLVEQIAIGQQGNAHLAAGGLAGHSQHQAGVGQRFATTDRNPVPSLCKVIQ